MSRDDSIANVLEFYREGLEPEDLTGFWNGDLVLVVELDGSIWYAPADAEHSGKVMAHAKEIGEAQLAKVGGDLIASMLPDWVDGELRQVQKDAFLRLAMIRMADELLRLHQQAFADCAVQM